MEWFGFAVGLLLVLSTLASVTATLVVPRGIRSRIAAAVLASVIGLFRMLAARRVEYEERDRLLSLAGPVVLLALVATWVAGIYVGFALLMWPFAESLPIAFSDAGSSMFTLGFDVPHGAAPTALTFFAAAFGLVVVALQIAYLPTLYGAFNRREQLVTMLESRSGVPAWGPEILARHELIDNTASLGSLYTQWEQWAADLAETHTTYQVLIVFRSPHPLRSWITALLSVLDAGALQLALNPFSAPPEARPFMRMGYMALREIASVMRVPFNPDPKPDDDVSLTRAEFDEALAELAAVGWRPERTSDEAWVHFRGWRVTYEAIAWAIADRVDAPPALWSGPRHRFRKAGIAPARPPHRSPSPERQAVMAITEARRQRRPVSLSGRRRSSPIDGPVAAPPPPADDGPAAELSRADRADAAAEQPAD